jgi:hypothetical protein
MKKLFLILATFTIIISCEKKQQNITSTFSVKSSSDYPGAEAKNLLDSNYTTIWNAGGTGQHWVEFSTNNPSDLSLVRFKIGAQPPSKYYYTVLVKDNSTGSYQNIISGNKLISTIDSFEIKIDKPNISSLKLVVESDSSWANVINVEIIK